MTSISTTASASAVPESSPTAVPTVNPETKPRGKIEGFCDSAFAHVRAVFAASFEHSPELGAALCVTLHGRTVVDLWGGFLDAARTMPWHRDTIANVFSATKGVVALCAHRLVERGALDLDAPVAAYWPEFAAAGKASLPVRYLLDHKAGLPAIRQIMTPGSLYDWHAMTAALAAESPWWEPGSKHGYHPVTFGFLVGELIRRVSGRSVGRFFGEEVAAPLGLDFQIGLGAEDPARIAELPPTISPPECAPSSLLASLADPESMTAKAFINPSDLVVPGVANTEPWRCAEIPACNGHGNARSLARMYGAMAHGELDGISLLEPQTIAAAIAEQSSGIDAVLGMESRFSLGFMLPSPMRPFGRGARTFGHSGAGGALGFGDPDAELGFGYVPNQTIASGLGGDPRWPNLIEAVYACL